MLLEHFSTHNFLKSTFYFSGAVYSSYSGCLQKWVSMSKAGGLLERQLKDCGDPSWWAFLQGIWKLGMVWCLHLNPGIFLFHWTLDWNVCLGFWRIIWVGLICFGHVVSGHGTGQFVVRSGTEIQPLRPWLQLYLQLVLIMMRPQVPCSHLANRSLRYPNLGRWRKKTSAKGAWFHGLKGLHSESRGAYVFFTWAIDCNIYIYKY